ncbi:MAG: DSD1 family PLP-dependent enzyme [Gemmataceae bacterium]|nr:DSD1 family PLP-dependent enzyme [Gemmataceae bacterium]
MTTIPPARVGMSIDQIDTPALVIDLEAYERNLDRMAGKLHGSPVRLRAHAKTHKCAIIARHQMARGAVGVCCQKVAEAEALIHAGVNNVLVSNQIVSPQKIARLVALAKQATVAVCVDHPANVRDLGRAAASADVRLPVLVEVDIGAGRCGTAPGQPTVDLARAIAAEPSLRFAGIQAYHGKAQHIYALADRRAAIEASVMLTRQTVGHLKAAGFNSPTVTGAGTGTYELELASGIYNELQAGSYVFMDVDYAKVEGSPHEFEHALFVLCQVMSRPTPDRAVVDAGLKAHSVDSGLPRVHGRPDIEFVGASDEHGTLKLRDPAAAPALGDLLRLIPGHCDPTVNLYDWYVCIRKNKVEALWPIIARGAIT